jgi:disulfide bond formation protein DsbB
MSRSAAIGLNALGLYAIALVLAVAFAAQLVLHEPPCPLCLLQRVQFAMLAIGPVLNIRYGPRPSHYGVSLLAALLGAAVAGRQILLHILPGDPGFGSALLGDHYYTWAFLCFAAAIALIAVVLLFDRQFETRADADAQHVPVSILARGAVWLVIVLTALNVLSTVLECGFKACPDDPKQYELLKGWR